jgi:4-amino-4-deoxy-L-arabinose transferase-like glycosyltransferase
MAYRHLFIVGVVLLIAASHLVSTFPNTAQYRFGADEGTYYQQAKEIQAHGSEGYRFLAERFIQDKDAHIFPPPLRVLPLAIDALALSVSDSFGSLSALSLICFVLLGLVAYYYIKDVWDQDLAVITVVLLAFSPLGSAMARRALIDSLTYLVTAFSLLSFLAYTVRRNSGRLMVFSSSLLLLQMTRETGFLLYPFYCAMLVYLHYRRHPEITLRAILLCFIVPVGVTAIIYQALYGAGTLYRIMNVIYFDTLTTPSDYILNFSSGPWYRYLLDFMLLSPLSILLAYFYTGYYLSRKQFDVQTAVLLSFFAYTIFVFDFLQMKNVRYVIFLDLVIRIIAAMGVRAIPSVFVENQRRRSIVIVALVVLLAVTDFRAFTNYFVTGNVYDPVSYNLLYMEKIVPTQASPLH